MNKIIISIIVTLVNSTLALILAVYFFSQFADNKTKHNIPLVLIAYVVFNLSLVLVKNPLLGMAITSICTFLFTYIYRIKIYNRVLLTLTYVAIAIVTELLSGISLMTIFSIDFALAQSGLFDILGILLSKFLAFIICAFIIHSKYSILYGNFRKQWISLYILPAATIVVIFFEHFSMYYFPQNSGLRIIAAISMMFLILSNMFIFKLVDNMHDSITMESKLLLTEEFIEKQAEQYNLLFESNKDIIQMRHDYKNLLLGVISDINSKRIDSATNLLLKELNIIESSNRNATFGNSVIDTVLNYKKEFAEQKGISIDFQQRNISKINISSTDLSILLGNALDNAIEATAKLSADTDRIVGVSIVVIHGKIIIIVTNNVESNIDIDNLQTGKTDLKYHGFGIIGMKTIAKKYDGEIIFECENRVFRVTITLKNGQNNV